MLTCRFGSLLILASGLAALPSASAQWPALRLHAIFPTGGQAGATLMVSVTAGEDLDELTGLRFSHPGITAALAPTTAEGATPAPPPCCGPATPSSTVASP